MSNQLTISDSSVLQRIRQQQLNRVRAIKGLPAHSQAFTCIAVDNSGSMFGHEEDVISGLNTILTSLKQHAGQTTLELLKFNHQIRSFLPQAGRPASSIYPVAAHQYEPNGGTALNDAIGRSIETADRQNANHTSIIIITDGEENMSREYTLYQICSLISARIAAGWQFIFIAIGHNATSAFTQYQIPADRQFNLLDVTPTTFSDMFSQIAQNLISYNLNQTETLALPQPQPQPKAGAE